MGEVSDKVGAGGGDHDFIRPTRQLDMPHRCLSAFIPQSSAHGVTRDCLECERSDELLSPIGHYDLNIRSLILQTTHHIRSLVGGNSTRNTKQDLAGLEVHAAIIATA